MRSFDENLNAYHQASESMKLKSRAYAGKIVSAKTDEESNEAWAKYYQYLGKQSEYFNAIAKEMVEIMNKHWWEFWK